MSEGVSKIELGKTYEVCAYWKKSLTEIEMYENESAKKKLNTEVLWRNGTFIVTPQSEEEVQYLQESLGEDGEIDYDDYEVCELWDIMMAVQKTLYSMEITLQKKNKIN